MFHLGKFPGGRGEQKLNGRHFGYSELHSKFGQEGAQRFQRGMNVPFSPAQNNFIHFYTTFPHLLTGLIEVASLHYYATGSLGSHQKQVCKEE